jgi:hypothetical protein
MAITQKYKNKEYKSRIDGEHTVQYNIWMAMKQRCNSKDLHVAHPSYKNCYICEEWLDFQVFAKWFDANYVEGYQLDKDLLVKGNKMYSPDTCCFIPQEINLAIIKPCIERELPIGVYKHRKRFVVHIKENKQSKYLGLFSTVEEAANCYINNKKQQLKALACKYRGKIPSRAYKTLINYNIN